MQVSCGARCCATRAAQKYDRDDDSSSTKRYLVCMVKCLRITLAERLTSANGTAMGGLRSEGGGSCALCMSDLEKIQSFRSTIC